MTKQAITIDDRSIKRFLIGLNKNQQNVVMAKTLNDVANISRAELRKQASQNWDVRRAGVLSRFRVDKATPQRLISAVGHLDWYAQDQLDNTDSTREPKAAKWLYQPLSGTTVGKNGKRTPYAPKRAVALATKGPGKRTGRKKKHKPFFIKQASGHLLIAQREGKASKPLILLYRMVRKQAIKPKLSMPAITSQVASKGQRFFNRNMQRALSKS